MSMTPMVIPAMVSASSQRRVYFGSHARMGNSWAAELRMEGRAQSAGGGSTDSEASGCWLPHEQECPCNSPGVRTGWR
jgi:hypothetical protein